MIIIQMKFIVFYVLIFMLSCISPKKQAAAEEKSKEERKVESIETSEAIIPVVRYFNYYDYASHTYETPDIPQTILDILRENIKDENSRDGYYWILEKLSEDGFNLDRLRSVTERAIRLDNIELIKEIFKYYKRFFRWSLFRIRSVAETGSLEIVKFLLDAGVKFDDYDDWYTDFSWFAAYCPNPDVIQFLIERGADINKKTLYHGNSVNHAAEHGMAENLQVLLAAGASFRIFDWNNITALMQAAKSGNDECVRILLDAGADIQAADDWGNTALMAAVGSGNEKSVRLLLEAGAVKHINAQNAWGSTALMEAAINGSGETIQTLIKAGADVNSGTWAGGYYAHTQWYLYSKGLTALMLASTVDAVKTLLAGGADVNLRDSHGDSAIYYQCFFYRNAETIKALIEAGSYMYIDKNRGRDLLRLSKRWSDWDENDEIITMLEQAGCADDDPNGEWDDYFHVDRH